MVATGRVVFFNVAKGFGFIRPDDGGRDIFVHASGIVGTGFRTLDRGARVEYEITDGDRGPRAVQVRPGS